MKKVTGRLVFIVTMLCLNAAGFAVSAGPAAAEDVVKIGFNYPETGPYAKEGLNQRRAADLATEEINAAGGILGKKVQLVYRDSKSNARVSTANAIELFDKEGVQMIFGGVSSGVALAVGEVAKQKNKIFFGTVTASTEVTAEKGSKTTFREWYDSYMAANALSGYMNSNFAGKKTFYVTSNYSWGWTTEAAFRKFTKTTDNTVHKAMLTKLGATDYNDVLSIAKDSKPAVLVLILFGQDLEIGLKQAYDMGIMKHTQIIIPHITLDVAMAVGPKVMEGVVGTTYWDWQVPYKFNYPKGKAFVENFAKKYNRYPTVTGAPAYVILQQYKDAVERAKSFETTAVIKTLEGHKYTGVKDEQYWREFDHQSIGTVYAIKGKPAAEVNKDKFKQDFFEIISSMKGDHAAIGKEEWIKNRAKVGMPATLE